jgi:hypothetical protein
MLEGGRVIDVNLATLPHNHNINIQRSTASTLNFSKGYKMKSFYLEVLLKKKKEPPRSTYPVHEACRDNKSTPTYT